MDLESIAMMTLLLTKQKTNVLTHSMTLYGWVQWNSQTRQQLNRQLSWPDKNLMEGWRALFSCNQAILIFTAGCNLLIFVLYCTIEIVQLRSTQFSGLLLTLSPKVIIFDRESNDYVWRNLPAFRYKFCHIIYYLISIRLYIYF